jgi:hypothetical protein
MALVEVNLQPYEGQKKNLNQIYGWDKQLNNRKTRTGYRLEMSVRDQSLNKLGCAIDFAPDILRFVYLSR